MSYPLQPYNTNNQALVQPQFNRGVVNRDGAVVDNLVGSMLGLANRLMGEILQSSPGVDGMSSFMGADPNNPHVKVFGISAMNVTQIARGPDGRPHIIQAHDERRLGPNGLWQTKKALRDPDRGIDKMQIGYYGGDRGGIIERRLDPSTGQYHQEIQRHTIPSNNPNFLHQWRTQSQQAIQQPQQQPQQQPLLALPQPQTQTPYQYYQRPQQVSSYAQPSLQARPAPPAYQYI